MRFDDAFDTVAEWLSEHHARYLEKYDGDPRADADDYQQIVSQYKERRAAARQVKQKRHAKSAEQKRRAKRSKQNRPKTPRRNTSDTRWETGDTAAAKFQAADAATTTAADSGASPPPAATLQPVRDAL